MHVEAILVFSDIATKWVNTELNTKYCTSLDEYTYEYITGKVELAWI